MEAGREMLLAEVLSPRGPAVLETSRGGAWRSSQSVGDVNGPGHLVIFSSGQSIR